jgi:hypothetical protein
LEGSRPAFATLEGDVNLPPTVLSLRLKAPMSACSVCTIRENDLTFFPVYWRKSRPFRRQGSRLKRVNASPLGPELAIFAAPVLPSLHLEIRTKNAPICFALCSRPNRKSVMRFHPKTRNPKVTDGGHCFDFRGRSCRK